MKNSSLLKRRQIKNSSDQHQPVSLASLVQEGGTEGSNPMNTNSMLVDLASLQAEVHQTAIFQTSPGEFDDLDDEAAVEIGDKTIEMKANDLEIICELGRGAYGVVEKMRHKKTKTEIAVKRIVATDNKIEQRRLRMDMEITKRSSACPHIVHYYGAMYRDGDVWICMEVMDLSLEKFYARAFGCGEAMPEYVLVNIAHAAVSALKYLHENLHVIHRDVKPSNMLIKRNGHVKICDFGVSAYLVDSVAKAIDAGCKPYMAPERVDPEGSRGTTTSGVTCGAWGSLWWRWLRGSSPTTRGQLCSNSSSRSCLTRRPGCLRGCFPVISPVLRRFVWTKMLIQEPGILSWSSMCS